MRYLVLFVSLSITWMTQTQASGFDTLVFRPAVSKNPGIFLWSPKVIGQYDMHFSTNFTFQKAPFKLLTQGQSTDVVLDNMLIQHFQFSLGIMERWLEAGFDFPVAWVVEYKDPNVSGSLHDSRTRAGETRLYFKSELMPEHPSRPFSLGILSSLWLPTGSREELLGNDSLALDLQVLLKLKGSEDFVFYTNAGFFFRQKYEFRDFEQTHQILYGLGTTYSLSNELSFSLEALGRTKLMSPFNRKSENPFEVSGAMRFSHPSEIWGIDFGGSAGIIRGAGVPDYKVFFGLHLQNRGDGD